MTAFTRLSGLAVAALSLLATTGAASGHGVAKHADITKRQNSAAVVGASGSTQPRLEIRQLEQDADQWNLFMLAMQDFQNTDHSSTTSWYQVAGIHGMPYVTWNNVQGSNPGSGYCPHSSPLFICWHRPYVALWEQLMLDSAQNVVNQFSGADKTRYQNALSTLRHPYWDWAEVPPSGNSADAMPLSMSNSTVTVNTPTGQQTIPNPLYSFTKMNPHSASDFTGIGGGDWDQWASTLRYPTTADASATSDEGAAVQALGNYNAQARAQVYRVLTACSNFLDMSNDGAAEQNANCGVSLESIHNGIHTFTGGQNQAGHMTYNNFAAYDPAFFLHHANVDRLFALWQSLHPNDYMPQTSQGSTNTYTINANAAVDGNTPLEPFANAAGQFHTCNSVRDISQFHYTYPELQAGNVAQAVNNLYGSNAIPQSLSSSSASSTPTSSATSGSSSASQPSSNSASSTATGASSSATSSPGGSSSGSSPFSGSGISTPFGTFGGSNGNNPNTPRFGGFSGFNPFSSIFNTRDTSADQTGSQSASASVSGSSGASASGSASGSATGSSSGSAAGASGSTSGSAAGTSGSTSGSAAGASGSTSGASGSAGSSAGATGSSGLTSTAAAASGSGAGEIGGAGSIIGGQQVSNGATSAPTPSLFSSTFGGTAPLGGASATGSLGAASPSGSSFPSLGGNGTTNSTGNSNLPSLLTPTGRTHDYTCHITSEKHGLGGTYTIFGFLGNDIPDSPDQWLSHPDFCGAHSVFAPLGIPTSNQMLVSGQISLTTSLVGKVASGELKSMDESDVLPYLAQNLNWRTATAAGQAVDNSQVPGLTVGAVSQKVMPAANSGSLPTYGNGNIQQNVTHGKAGGIQNGMQYDWWNVCGAAPAQSASSY